MGARATWFSKAPSAARAEYHLCRGVNGDTLREAPMALEQNQLGFLLGQYSLPQRQRCQGQTFPGTG